MQKSESVMLYFGLLLVTIALAMATEQEPKTAEQKLILDGGFTGERKPDASAQALADSVRKQVVQQLGARDPIREFKVVSVKTQVVAGTNYRMKIQIGRNEYIHIKVFKPLPHTKEGPKVTQVESNKSRNDPL